MTCADDTIIFTSNNELNIVESYLTQDINSLPTGFCNNELIINLKKGKTEAMIFGTAKKLSKFKKRLLYSGRGLGLSVSMCSDLYSCDLEINSVFNECTNG